MKEIGYKVKRERLKRNMTQMELANGICTQSQISKIEKGTLIPMSSLLFEISRKLNISLDELTNDSSNDSDASTMDKRYIDSLLVKRDYHSLESYLSNINKDKIRNLNDEIFYRWLLLICNHKLRSVNVIDDLKLLLNDSSDFIDPELEVRILNNLGSFLLNEKKMDEGLKFLQKALNEATSKNLEYALVIKVMYNLSNYYFRLEEWSKLYQLVNEALIYSYHYNDYNLVPELIYSKNYASNQLSINLTDSNEEIHFAKFLADKQHKYEILHLIEKHLS